MSSLTLVILALLTVSPGHYAKHIQYGALPPRHEAVRLSENVEHGAFVAGVPRAVLTAHWYYESTLNHKAVNKVSGAFGIGALLPSSIWARGWMKSCARDQYACDVKDAEYAAIALRHYLDKCGTMLRALTAYRVGHCKVPGPKAKATLRLAQRIQYRMDHPSPTPFKAPPLPLGT